MKKVIYFIFATLMSLWVISCTEESDGVKPIDNSQKGEVEVAEILSFSSIEEMKDVSLKLIQMDDATRAAWYKNNGNFISQEDFRWTVIEELNGCATLEEARAIQEKYKEYFIYNPRENEIDISPYIPSSRVMCKYVCNKQGEVKIAGEVFNFNDITDFSELGIEDIVPETRRPSNHNKVNSVAAEHDKRQYQIRALRDHSFSGDGAPWVVLELCAWSKGIWWSQYKTIYNLKLIKGTVSGFIPSYYSPAWKQWADNPGVAKDTAEVGSGSLLVVGPTYYVGGNLWQKGKMELDVYSRGTGTAGLRRLVIDI